MNPLYLQTLRTLTLDRPYLDVALTDVTVGQTFPRREGGFDTVVCLNVVEHVDDDVGALREKSIIDRWAAQTAAFPHPNPGSIYRVRLIHASPASATAKP